MKECAEPTHTNTDKLAKEESRTEHNLNTENLTSADGIDTDEIGRVEAIRSLLGQDVILLPIPRGEKGPKFSGWQSTGIEMLDDPVYLHQLETGNIGVLLGYSSGGLCAIDIDDDAAVEPFLTLNALLRDTLRTRGARGQQIWVRIDGDYPPLTKLKHNNQDWGEWRATGGQSVISGTHPSGSEYQMVKRVSPVTMQFDQIIWPEGMQCPWRIEKTEHDLLVEAEGQPYVVNSSGGITLNQIYFVRKFLIENLVSYDSGIGEFYKYDVADGLWKIVTEGSIKRQFSADLTSVAHQTGEKAIFLKRTDTTLNGFVNLLRSESECRTAFSSRPSAIHVKNGMICFDGDRNLLKSFHPQYLSRNQCPYGFDPNADCPKFKQELLGGALNDEDIALLQKWAGAILLGTNTAQRFLLMEGTAGGGKSTLMNVLEQIIGTRNVAEMRTSHLGDRFELFSFVGKTLLTGKDVAPDFLMHKSVHVLKALVGHDRLEAEKKGFNERVQIIGDFNVGITCNAELNIRLQGDLGAWRRRLLVIKYERPAPKVKIPDFAGQLLKEEGSGILRWMVEGAVALIEDLNSHGDYRLTDAQQGRIDALLSQSDSVKLFVEQRVVRDHTSDVSVAELHLAYLEYCEAKGWQAYSWGEFHKAISNHMLAIRKVHKNHCVLRGGKTARGFKNVSILQGEVEK